MECSFVNLPGSQWCAMCDGDLTRVSAPPDVAVRPRVRTSNWRLQPRLGNGEKSPKVEIETIDQMIVNAASPDKLTALADTVQETDTTEDAMGQLRTKNSQRSEHTPNTNSECRTCGCSCEFDAAGDRVCWCDACYKTGCSPGPIEACESYCPRIGNYRLPIATTLSFCSESARVTFLSFLFRAFGQEVMAERSWYIRHVQGDAYYTSALWWCISSAQDEHVTDKTVDHLTNQLESQSFDGDNSSYDSYDPALHAELWHNQAEYDSDRYHRAHGTGIYANDSEDSD